MPNNMVNTSSAITVTMLIVPSWSECSRRQKGICLECAYFSEKVERRAVVEFVRFRMHLVAMLRILTNPARGRSESILGIGAHRFDAIVGHRGRSRDDRRIDRLR